MTAYHDHGDGESGFHLEVADRLIPAALAHDEHIFAAAPPGLWKLKIRLQAIPWRTRVAEIRRRSTRHIPRRSTVGGRRDIRAPDQITASGEPLRCDIAPPVRPEDRQVAIHWPLRARHSHKLLAVTAKSPSEGL